MRRTLGFAQIFFVSLLLGFVTGCATPDPLADLPPWTRQPTRIVDGGYIVYIGSSLDRSGERAQFKAEGIALEDLANECSVVPQGTRIEDRYIHHGQKEQTAYVKIGVEFEACEAAKKAVEPETIRRVANATFTQQLKRYQDFSETGDLDPADSKEIIAPSEIAAAPVKQAGQSDNMHFYITRQYVAYEKEVVVLAPPTAYAANSPETQRFASVVAPQAQQVIATEHANPDLIKHATPWSQVLNRPHLNRPGTLTARLPKRAPEKSLTPPPKPAPAKEPQPRRSKGRGKRRH